MAAISEKLELLGKGLYKDIPDVLTVSSIPTASELDYVGAEDFMKTMLDKILPVAVAEKIDFRQLLEIDFFWLCRCLRILNYGPYYTTNTIFCGNCGKTAYGDYQVDLRAIDCKPLPDKFVNDIVISSDKFLDFEGDVHVKLMTIQQKINSEKDTAFSIGNGKINMEFARMCYSISSIKGNTNLSPIEIKLLIQKEFSSADYVILRDEVNNATDYGLRAGGSTSCPKCGSEKAAFVTLVDDRFFKPTLGDLREWGNDRRKRADENVSGNTSTALRKHN